MNSILMTVRKASIKCSKWMIVLEA